jgi:hypothetical protein
MNHINVPYVLTHQYCGVAELALVIPTLAKQPKYYNPQYRKYRELVRYEPLVIGGLYYRVVKQFV